MKIRIVRAHSKKRFIPLGWIIKKTQKTEWHHYAIEYGDYIYTDARRKGIRKVSKATWFKRYREVSSTVVELPCSFEVLDAYVDGKVGAKYPFWQLIGIGLISFGWIKHNPFGKNKRYLVCHEYVVVLLARFLKLDIKDSDDFTFGDVEEVIDSVRTND